MSVAFTREESTETAAEVELPDRPISPHPNLVTASGLEALTDAMSQSRTAYEAAADPGRTAERRRMSWSPLGISDISPNVSGQLSSLRRLRISARLPSGIG